MEDGSNGSCVCVWIHILRLADIVPYWSDRVLMGCSSEDPSTFISVSPLA
jgi:hypothetical protein